MGFRKVDCVAELNEAIRNDAELAEYVREFEQEYELMQSLVKARKELGLTQKDISKRSGLTQQMVSRMEKIDNSPTLTNFLRYISAIGLDINVVKKQI